MQYFLNIRVLCVCKQLFISERFFLYYSDLTGIEITIKEKHIYSHKVSLNVTSVGSSDKLTYRSKQDGNLSSVM